MTSNSGDLCLRPGFLHLDLYSLFEKDKESLRRRVNFLKKKLNTEHESLHCALNNLIAVLLAQLRHHLNEARTVLESCKKKYPENINTIFHLKYVYKKLSQTKRSELFQGLDEELAKCQCSEEQKAFCFLEQGFVLLLEETVDRKDVALKKLEEIFEILNKDDETSKTALNHSRDAWETLRSGLISKDKHKITVQELCVNKLTRGIEIMLGLTNNRLDPNLIVWKYHLAVAYLNQEESHQKFQKIIAQFTEVISALTQPHSDVLQKYKGRSVIFLVEYLLRGPRRKTNMITDWVQKDLTTVKNDNIKKILLDPLSNGLPIALECAPNDEIRKVYDGKCIWHISRTMRKNGTCKLRALIEAEKSLNQINPIDLSPDVHKICISTRLRCRMDIAYLQNDKMKKIDWLKKAHDDAVESCHLGNDPEDCLFLGSICKSLAIQFRGNSGKPTNFSEDYFHEALSHYNNARICFEGYFQMKALQGMGESLVYLQKHKKASECMFQAMLLSLEIESKSNSREHVELESKSTLVKKKELHTTANSLMVPTYSLDSGIYHSVESSESRSRHESSSSSVATEEREFQNSNYRADKRQNSTTKCLKYCCSYLIQYYQQMSGDAIRKSALIELRDTIVIGKQLNANIEYVLQYLCETHFSAMIDFVFGRLLSFKIQQHHNIAGYCLQYLLENSKGSYTADSLKVLKMEYDNNKPSETCTLNIKEKKFQTPEWQYQPGPEKYLKDESFTYDFFVSHSSKDSEWVKRFIVDRLEQRMDENEIQLKGCFADRDFIPGKTIFDNITEAVHKSSIIIFVVTQGFIDSHWCNYELDQSLYDSLTRRRDCIVPVLKNECNIPQKLNTITYLDLTDTTKFWSNLNKLKKRVASKE